MEVCADGTLQLASNWLWFDMTASSVALALVPTGDMFYLPHGIARRVFGM